MPSAAPSLSAVRAKRTGPRASPMPRCHRRAARETAARDRRSDEDPLWRHSPVVTWRTMPVPPPRSLSPSKVSAFTDCPLAFRLALIDRIPEPPSPHALKGTLVHSALESLFWSHPSGERDVETALAELHRAWVSLQEDPDFKCLELAADGREAFLTDAETLVRNYFSLEDPNAVTAVGMELGLEAEHDGVRLRGIIDRLDLTAAGDLVVVDYKTGRAPTARFEQGKLKGVQFYAALCESVLGQAPVEVRLLHLREPLTIIAQPNAQSLRGHRQRTAAVWAAIERACGTGDFRPRPSPLCSFCNYRPLCPSHGGTPPSLPGDGPPAPAEGGVPPGQVTVPAQTVPAQTVPAPLAS